MAEFILTKRQWLALGKVFGREIDGRHVLQSKARIYDEMERGGLVARDEVSFGRDRFGEIKVSGWALTDRGRLLYCASCDRFSDEPIEERALCVASSCVARDDCSILAQWMNVACSSASSAQRTPPPRRPPRSRCRSGSW